MVLIASSPFFLNILKKNKNSHPLIYMRGVKSENLTTMVDFFHHGETNVFQENFDSFLVLAEELQLKGLSGDLLPKLGEETALPLVQDQRAASRRAWQCYTILVIVVTKPLWYSAGLDDEFSLEVLATKPATKFLGAFVDSRYSNYSCWLFFSFQLLWKLSTMVMPTTTRLWQFLTGESPLANWLVLAARSLNLKASKNGTSDLSRNARGAQVWRVTKHRPC